MLFVLSIFYKIIVLKYFFNITFPIHQFTHWLICWMLVLLDLCLHFTKLFFIIARWNCFSHASAPTGLVLDYSKRRLHTNPTSPFWKLHTCLHLKSASKVTYRHDLRFLFLSAKVTQQPKIKSSPSPQVTADFRFSQKLISWLWRNAQKFNQRCI